MLDEPIDENASENLTGNAKEGDASMVVTG